MLGFNQRELLVLQVKESREKTHGKSKKHERMTNRPAIGGAGFPLPRQYMPGVHGSQAVSLCWYTWGLKVPAGHGNSSDHVVPAGQ